MTLPSHLYLASIKTLTKLIIAVNTSGFANIYIKKIL